MKHFCIGLLIGVFLSAASVAGFGLTVLRDSEGWEIWTPTESENVVDTVNQMFGEIMRLRMILAKGGCT